MKKFIKLTSHIFSILSLAVFVFLGGIVVKFADKNASMENGLRKAPSPFSLEPGGTRALADVPTGMDGGSGVGGIPGGDGGCDGSGGGGGGGGGDC